MSNPRRVALINALYQRSSEGKVLWEKTLDEGVFQANFPQYSVRIYGKGALYYVQIYNEDGELVEEFNDEDIKEGSFPRTGGPFTAMKLTHEIARSMSFGVDKAIDLILSELDDK